MEGLLQHVIICLLFFAAALAVARILLPPDFQRAAYIVIAVLFLLWVVSIFFGTRVFG